LNKNLKIWCLKTKIDLGCENIGLKKKVEFERQTLPENQNRSCALNYAQQRLGDNGLRCTRSRQPADA